MEFRKPLLALRLAYVAFLLSLVAYAAQTPSPTPTIDIAPLIAAIVAQKWSAAAALVVGLIVAAAKQGWLSAYLAAKLPKWFLPYLAVVLGSAGMISAAILGGQPWLPALESGILAGVLSVFGHQTVVEGLRGGKEIIPARKTSSVKDTQPAPPPEKEA